MNTDTAFFQKKTFHNWQRQAKSGQFSNELVDRHS